MSENILAQHKITSFRKKKLISQELASFLQLKLHQNDKMVVSLFQTLEWSKNEEAFFEKIYQLPIFDSKAVSNFSTETSLKIRSRPPSVIVPSNRTLKNYMKDHHNTSLEYLVKKEKKEVKIQKPVTLTKMKCYQEIKFESDVSDTDDNKELCSMNSLDLNISRNSENKERPLQSVTNFLKENRENSNIGMMEKKMSIDEILEKYDHGEKNEEIFEEKKIDEFDYLSDGVEEEQPKNGKQIPIIDRS